jgi:hypothetical protein
MAFIRIQLPLFLTLSAQCCVSTLQSNLQLYARKGRRSHSGVESVLMRTSTPMRSLFTIAHDNWSASGQIDHSNFNEESACAAFHGFNISALSVCLIVRYSNLAGARQGRGGCETVRKLKGLETQGRGACTFAKGNALIGRNRGRLSREKYRLKPEPSYPLLYS